MFDPNYTGVGHQPMFFDQMSTIYNHYMVFRTTLIAEFVAKTYDAIAVIYIDDDTSFATTLDEAAEQQTAVKKVIPLSAARPVRFQLTWDAKKWFGGDVYDNPDLRGTSSADPSELSFFVLKVQSADGTTTTAVQGTVTLLFDAVWTELKTVGSS